ncbi:MAG: TIGR02757 family protein [Treponema sp.]|nr:TIGR02757 family protein [Treponema sp.]
MHGRTDELNSSSTSNSSLAEKLIGLAQKYESADFLLKDPSQFMHRYSKVAEAEAVAFIAANLAFGRRDQILSHVELILSQCKSSPLDWILSKKYLDFFPENKISFYRMYTNADMRLFFEGLRKILESSESIGDFFKKKWEKESLKEGRDKIYLHQVISSAFSPDCALLPHSKSSAAKKVNMLLRWMVRDNSPVDLGLWKWFDKKNLLMPLDTHVMQQSVELGLIQSKSANLKTALELTKKVAGIFPDDPVKADFALFGLGVSLQ